MTALNDPIGQAILDYAQSGKSKDITVLSDICEDDVIPSFYLLRSWDEMPEIERMAIEHCSGKVLDIGAGAGIHTKELLKRGVDASAIDVSPGAVSYMQSVGIPAREHSFYELKDESYDTLLFMMNGIGIAGKLSRLKPTLLHARTLLSKNGKILCDSTDIRYLYADDDGGFWMDLNAEYYGDIQFRMHYGQHDSGWFDWLYVDSETLLNIAEECGFTGTILLEDNDQYLVELCIND